MTEPEDILDIEIQEAAKRIREATVASPEPLGVSDVIALRLVPVSVFGSEGCMEGCDHCKEHAGHGLMDAVSSWSDCNRAEGHIFRFDDIDRADAETLTITVYIPRSELWKVAHNWEDDDLDDKLHPRPE